jgi:hypothetical protein
VSPFLGAFRADAPHSLDFNFSWEIFDPRLSQKKMFLIILRYFIRCVHMVNATLICQNQNISIWHAMVVLIYGWSTINIHGASVPLVVLSF